MLSDVEGRKGNGDQSLSLVIREDSGGEERPSSADHLNLGNERHRLRHKTARN